MNAVSRLFAQMKHETPPIYLKKSLEYYGALIKKRMKPAALVTLSVKGEDMLAIWKEYHETVLCHVGLSACIMHRCENRICILLYDRPFLEDVLFSKAIRQWLMEHAGYPKKKDLDAFLNFLHMRFMQQACPDELGIFLGYPLCDVISYIENEGKDYAYCGYWKVYHDVEACMEQFALYDQIRNEAAAALVDNQEHRLAI